MIKNNKENIFGRMEATPPDVFYEGKSTSTVDVTVDNSKREISADVILPALIGTGDNLAYPSYLGNQNRRLIIDLEQSVADEVSRAVNEESKLKNNIEDLHEYVIFSDNLLNSHIQQEQERAIQSESDLNSKIDNLKIPENLSDLENDVGYAKLSDIPDVSEFITAIPSEYITETELDSKKYTTEETVEEMIKNSSSSNIKPEDIINLLQELKFIDGGNAPL